MSTSSTFRTRPLGSLAGIAVSGLLLASSLLAAEAPSQTQLTAAERTALVQLLSATHAKTLWLAQEIGEESWSQRPTPDAWSAGEVFEHLVLAEGAIRARITTLLEERAPVDWTQVERLGLQELVGLGSDRSRKFQAPEPIQPSGKMSRDEALQRLMAARAQTIQWVLSTDAELHAVAAKGPIGAVLDGHDWVGLLAAHNLRHNEQLKEILSAVTR